MFPGLGMWGGRGLVPLVVPGALSSLMTFTRGAGGAVLGSDGLTWSEASSNVARFHGVSRRLLIEASRTNGVRNPRMEGAGPTTQPTGWFGWVGLPSGITPGYGTPFVENGQNTMIVTLTGTAGASGTGRLVMGARNHFALATGQIAAGAVGVGLGSDGSLTGVNSITLAIRGYNSSSSDTETVASSVITGSLATAQQRFPVVGTAANVSTAFAAMSMLAAISSGATVNLKLRISWPTIEQAPFPSTPALPLVAAPNEATRPADQASALLTALGIPDTGGCTIFWSGVLPQAAPTGLDQIIWQMDDGTANNRLRLRNLAGGATLVPTRVIGGASLDGTSAGTMTPGALLTVAATINAGRLAVSFNGGALQAVTGGPTSGLTTLRLGGNSSGTGSMNGETARFGFLPYVVADADLPARGAAFPTT